ncbi:hypothetical protein Y032_0032g2509 [Ancylostoma ceylanicum]|uniref:Uncharacterized protein n=1 Tax=Ancylostoma ceylanicum TaxID=53326 RepID=A0A016UPL2_9BILA|nr:hypothetical protein Y032_0032g2509 [Ancylostoma ceylanicum]
MKTDQNFIISVREFYVVKVFKTAAKHYHRPYKELRESLLYYRAESMRQWIWNRKPHLGPPNSSDFALSDDLLLASFKLFLEEKNFKTVTKPSFGCVATSSHGTATFHDRALTLCVEDVEVMCEKVANFNFHIDWQVFRSTCSSLERPTVVCTTVKINETWCLLVCVYQST